MSSTGVAGEARFTVPLDALIAAVKAVEPHAVRPSGRAEDVDALARVRFIAGRGELYVLATNGITTAHATVRIDEESDSRDERTAADDGVFVLDADPTEIKNIVRRFLRGRRKRDGVRPTIELHWTDGGLDLVDVTGREGTIPGLDVPAVPGRSLGLLMLDPHPDYPDVVARLGEALVGVGESPAAKPLVADHAVFGVFRHAAVAYGQPLEFEATGSAASRGFVVQCGPWFVGAVSSKHNDDDSLAKRRRARTVHLHRLAGGPAPEPPLGKDEAGLPDPHEHDDPHGEDRESDAPFYSPDEDPNAVTLDGDPSPAAVEAAAAVEPEGDREPAPPTPIKAGRSRAAKTAAAEEPAAKATGKGAATKAAATPRKRVAKAPSTSPFLAPVKG